MSKEINIKPNLYSYVYPCFGYCSPFYHNFYIIIHNTYFIITSFFSFDVLISQSNHLENIRIPCFNSWSGDRHQVSPRFSGYRVAAFDRFDRVARVRFLINLKKFFLSWVLQGQPKFPPTHRTELHTPWLLKTMARHGRIRYKVSRLGTSSAHLLLWYGKVYWTKTHPTTLPEEKSEITRDETNNRREVLKISARLKGSKGTREGCMSWRGLFTSVKTVRKAATWSVCGVSGRRRRRGLCGGGR